MFNPAVLHPPPDPLFVDELRKIDPSLRVVFGYERYFKNCWVIERRMDNEAYRLKYRSFLESEDPRFVDQPIYDTAKPLLDETGQETGGYEQIGTRKFDLAPEWEWIKNIETKDGKYKPFGMDDILALKREYAWNRNHAYSRARYEEEERKKDQAVEDAKAAKRRETILESVDEAWHTYGKIAVGKPIKQEQGE